MRTFDAYAGVPQSGLWLRQLSSAPQPARGMMLGHAGSAAAGAVERAGRGPRSSERMVCRRRLRSRPSTDAHLDVANASTDVDRPGRGLTPVLVRVGVGPLAHAALDPRPRRPTPAIDVPDRDRALGRAVPLESDQLGGHPGVHAAIEPGAVSVAAS